LHGRGDRTYAHASADRPADDPLLQEIVGRISSNAFAARATVVDAADYLDAQAASIIDGVVDQDVAHEAAFAAARAKVVVDSLATQSASMLFDVGGASAIKQSFNLDRHWRNARTLASHNPATYKARAIGDREINNAPVPAGGFF
jgi:alkylation response protein AidB-like acyl-CoA dehydrogenase